MSAWLLLERSRQLLPQVYQLLGAPKLSMLFNSTELAVYGDQSPILVAVDETSALLKAVRQAPEDWPGLIIRSEHSKELLLAHLRQILLVRFGENRRGVLRYSSPLTASYFFPACQGAQLGVWLGPISSLEWYGGTWAQRATSEIGWRTLENPEARDGSAALGGERLLSADQQQAFQQQDRDHFLYCWWSKQRGVSFPHSQEWLLEGLQWGFTNPDFLERYLMLRRACPQPALPLAMADVDDEKRLALLQAHLQQPRIGLES